MPEAKRCAVFGEGAVTDHTRPSEVVCEVLCGDFLLDMLHGQVN